MRGKAAVRACTPVMDGAIAAAALWREPILTAMARNVDDGVDVVRRASLRAVLLAGRSLAVYRAAYSGGIAMGSWGWGRLTEAAGVDVAIACIRYADALLGLWVRMPRISARRRRRDAGRFRGPLVVEIEYRVAR